MYSAAYVNYCTVLYITIPHLLVSLRFTMDSLYFDCRKTWKGIKQKGKVGNETATVHSSAIGQTLRCIVTNQHTHTYPVQVLPVTAVILRIALFSTNSPYSTSWGRGGWEYASSTLSLTSALGGNTGYGKPPPHRESNAEPSLYWRNYPGRCGLPCTGTYWRTATRDEHDTRQP